MADFKLDASGDLDLSTGDIQIITGNAAIAQELTIRLRFFLGEWFLDVREGIPYIQQFFRKNPNPNIIRDVIARVVRGTPGVIDLLSLSFDLDTVARRLSVSLSAQTTSDEGPLVFEEFIL
ncbi:MAG: hypothetical protein MJA83_05665 [Gammaproteobacteria bacterium]|nr:hypothetical protein [Gammaproteobacteria bacterium]